MTDPHTDDQNGTQWLTTDTPSGSAPIATDPVTAASTATSAATSSSARSAGNRWATSGASGSVANEADPHTDDLADRLDPGEYHAVILDAETAAAAAAELRRLRHRDAALTTLLDAVGEGENLRGIAERIVRKPHLNMHADYLIGIAAAVEGIDQEHER